MSLGNKKQKQEWPHLLSFPVTPNGVFVFPTLITLGAAELEVPFQKEVDSAKGHSFL